MRDEDQGDSSLSRTSLLPAQQRSKAILGSSPSGNHCRRDGGGRYILNAQQFTLKVSSFSPKRSQDLAHYCGRSPNCFPSRLLSIPPHQPPQSSTCTALLFKQPLSAYSHSSDSWPCPQTKTLNRLSSPASWPFPPAFSVSLQHRDKR